MTDADLDKLEALAKAATPGPWGVENDFVVTLDPVENDMERRALADARYFHMPRAEANAAFIAAANPATIKSLIASAREAAAEIERLTGKLDRYENARLSDVSDEEAGRMIKAFFATVEQWSGEEWEDERARRLGLMNMGLMQAMIMAAQSNAETFTHTVNGLTHKGDALGDWIVTIARAANPPQPQKGGGG